jgi:hypothetical protein
MLQIGDAVTEFPPATVIKNILPEVGKKWR